MSPNCRALHLVISLLRVTLFPRLPCTVARTTPNIVNQSCPKPEQTRVKLPRQVGCRQIPFLHACPICNKRHCLLASPPSEGMLPC
ncbi:hypothetical protein EJ06DRAFT_293069 [Trichodelitschia bisporula]|uniref:Secreted protein n=1 Tax=Trichodelitschia bisporula TaxID=703511 RepID=A0A6G1I640_9PEZI|nr:hypothetical protein EJ06DRAFT_293069 [Trichodelitschia bisporula]